MKKLFIHTPVFRFLSPIFSGIVAYLLILLINNNIEQLQEQFLGQELYVCITLSYITHEFSRLLLWLFKFIPTFFGTLFMLFLRMIISLVLAIGIISLLVNIYYQNVSGYTPSFEELFIFNSIYSWIPVFYVLLDLSHKYLYKINTRRLENELLIKQNIEEDFKQFKREINPELLFESFETLLALIQEDKNLVDEFIDHLATIYRYILSSKKNQLVAIQEELEILNELIKLYNHLPYKKITIDVKGEHQFLIVPGTLLFVIEQIIKTTIVSSNVNLVITIEAKENYFELSYVTEDKIAAKFNHDTIQDISSVYSIYSNEDIQLVTKDGTRSIAIPMLEIKS